MIYDTFFIFSIAHDFVFFNSKSANMMKSERLLTVAEFIFPVKNAHAVARQCHAKILPDTHDKHTAPQPHRNIAAETAKSVYDCRNRRSAGARTAGICFPATALPDTHFKRILRNNADEFRIDTFRKHRVLFEKRTDHFKRNGPHIVGKYHRVRISH